jgi:hypothetical protein
MDKKAMAMTIHTKAKLEGDRKGAKWNEANYSSN